MQRLLWLPLLGCLLAGCGTSKPSAPAPKVIVSQETMLVGKVSRVNDLARFAVLNFPVGTLPMLEQRMGVYRSGLKVGEVKVSGPRIEDNIAADILSGEIQVGDEVRAN